MSAWQSGTASQRKPGDAGILGPGILMEGAPLTATVTQAILQGWPPEQVAGTLKMERPGARADRYPMRPSASSFTRVPAVGA